jgi:kinetochore protein Spc25
LNFNTTTYYLDITTTIMATMAYEMSLSNSLSRSHMAPDAPFMADQLPSVNFNFEDLRERMARFTARFDKFIDEGRKRVLEEKNQFRINLTELHGMVVPI